jgi:hypothetical protein
MHGCTRALRGTNPLFARTLNPCASLACACPASAYSPPSPCMYAHRRGMSSANVLSLAGPAHDPVHLSQFAGSHRSLPPPQTASRNQEHMQCTLLRRAAMQTRCPRCSWPPRTASTTRSLFGCLTHRPMVGSPPCSSSTHTAQDTEGKTPLFYAIINNKRTCVEVRPRSRLKGNWISHSCSRAQLLIAAKCKVNHADASGQTPLHMAGVCCFCWPSLLVFISFLLVFVQSAFHGNAAVVQLLIKNGSHDGTCVLCDVDVILVDLNRRQGGSAGQFRQDPAPSVHQSNRSSVCLLYVSMYVYTHH